MKHISILVPEGDCSLTHLDATQQIFTEVNVFLAAQDRDPLFEVELVGMHKEAQPKKRFYSVTPQRSLEEVKHTDLIIIPAIQGDLSTALSQNEPLLNWIRGHYKKGAEIASFCLGSFLLGATGLLDGRRCTTHWSMTARFKELFPEAILLPDKILTDEGGIYTSGGALSFQNLIVYLVEKYAGRDTAILVAKTFMIDIDRESQSPFIIFQGQKDHGDEPVGKVQSYIEKSFSERISIEELAAMAALSRRNFERRFRRATSNSVLEYLQRVRIESAKKQLETSGKNINEVMYEVGYSDLKAFRSVFKKLTGLSPVAYREKYNPRRMVSSEQ